MAFQSAKSLRAIDGPGKHRPFGAHLVERVDVGGGKFRCDDQDFVSACRDLGKQRSA